MPTADNFFVITGGPSTGKTTLVEALKKQDHHTVAEAAREILEEQEARGDVCTYRNTAQFVETELQRSVASYSKAQQENKRAATFFDRGIPDIIAYARFRNIPMSAALEEAARTYRYNKTVFIAPPWCEIYCTDEERTESYAESIKLFHAIVATYQEYGYSLVELPRISVQGRVQFVEDHIGHV
jgi:predicted ATPase